MRVPRRVAACALALVLLPAAALAASGSRSAETVSGASPDVKGLTKGLVANLKARYQVAPGYARLYTTDDCDRYSYPVMKSCFGNNPAAPYIFPIVPTWPGEFVDPALRNAFGATKRGYSATYRLDRREAIVVFGLMPPPGRYLGIQSYLATRKGTFDTASSTYQFFATRYPNFLDVLFAKVPGNPSRIESFSSLGNSINDVVLDRRAGSSFGTLKAFVITPDRTMNRSVRKALARVGIPAKDTFTEPVSSDGASLGLGEAADDFLTLIRYAMPDNAAAGDAWRRTLPLGVLRVRERPSSKRTPAPYPAPVLAARSATPEAQYSAQLNDLVGAVCRRWGTCTSPTPLVDGQGPPVNAVGPACRLIGMNCLADTQDTTYMFSTNLTLDHGEVYALASTLATQTGNATYVGISVNQTSKFKGVANLDDAKLRGSAASYTTGPDADKLFVYYLTRSCKGLEALTAGRCLSITADLVPPGDSFKIVQRTYIRPGTERGPESTQLLRPIVVGVVAPQ